MSQQSRWGMVWVMVPNKWFCPTRIQEPFPQKSGLKIHQERMGGTEACYSREGGTMSIGLQATCGL